MDSDLVVNLGREVLWLSLKLAAPMLLVGLIVGVLFAVFQAVTSVQEQTMTLIPKMLAVLATAVLLLPWILRTLSDFTVRMLERMATIPGVNAVEAFFARPDLTLLLLVRVSVALFALPVLRAGTRVNAARLVIAVSLAMLLAPRILDTGAATAPLDVADYVVASLREVLTGLFLGFAASVAFETARFAGALIARDMGMGIAEMADPLNGSRSGTMALLFEVLALLLFFQWDAHHWLLQGIVESFERVPIGRATLRMEFVPFLIGLVSELFASGIVLAAPILCVLLLITVSMALVARAVPQMNVLEAGFAWRIGGAMVALVVFLPLIGQGMTRVAAQVREALFQALEVL